MCLGVSSKKDNSRCVMSSARLSIVVAVVVVADNDISTHLTFITIEHNISETGHKKMCLTSYANNKGADQPAHPRSLISSFVIRCLDSIISIDSIAEISRT